MDTKSWVNLLISNGDDDFNKGNIKNAIEHYDRALKKDPNNIIALYKKGYALDELGKYKEAVKSYDKVLKIDPKCIRAWNNKGCALDELSKYKEAIESYNEVLKIDSKDSDAWINKGYALDEIGMYQDAIYSYTQAIKIDPKNSMALRNRGYTNFKLGQYQLAVDDYDSALKIEPNNNDARICRKKALEKLIEKKEDHKPKKIEEKSDATENLEKSPKTKLDIPQFDNLIELGIIELKNKSFNEANKYFRDALNLEYDNNIALSKIINCILTLGNIAVDEKDYDLASKYSNEFFNIQSFIKSDSINSLKNNNILDNLINLNFRIAEGYLKDNEFKDAFKSLTKTIKLINNKHDHISLDINRLLLLANTSIRNKDYENANKYFERVISLDPDNLYAISGELEIYIKLGDKKLKKSSYNEALNIYDKASETYDDVRILNGKGLALAGIGDLEEAEKCFNEVLIKSPNRLTTLLHLSDTLYKLNKIDEGYNSINRYLEIDKHNIEACLLKIKFLIHNREYEKAFNIINNALYYSNSADLIYYKNKILQKQGKYEDALDEINKALNIDPKNEIFKKELNNLSLKIENLSNSKKEIQSIK